MAYFCFEGSFISTPQNLSMEKIMLFLGPFLNFLRSESGPTSLFVVPISWLCDESTFLHAKVVSKLFWMHGVRFECQDRPAMAQSKYYRNEPVEGLHRVLLSEEEEGRCVLIIHSPCRKRAWSYRLRHPEISCEEMRRNVLQMLKGKKEFRVRI